MYVKHNKKSPPEKIKIDSSAGIEKLIIVTYISKYCYFKMRELFFYL